MQKIKKGLSKIHAWHLGLLITIVFLVAHISHIASATYSVDGRQSGLFAYLEQSFFDYRVKSRGTRMISDKVGMLAIDEKSVAKFGRWPFPRKSYVDALKNLKSAGARWIVFDAIYSEPESISLNDALEPLGDLLKLSLSPEGILDPRRFAEGINSLLQVSPGDKAFGSAITEFGNLIQAVVFLPPEEGEPLERDWESGRKTILANLVDSVERKNSDAKRQKEKIFPLVNTASILGAKPLLGFINNPVDSDGLFRRYQLVSEIPATEKEDVNQNRKYFPSVGLQVAAKYLNRKIHVVYDDFSISRIFLVDGAGDHLSIPLNGRQGTMLINHYGEHEVTEGNYTPQRISLADAAENKIPKKIPDILFMGSTITGADDKRPSPLNPHANGVEHHIAVVENILSQDFLHRPLHYTLSELFFTFVCGILLCVLLTRAKAVASLGIVLIFHLLLEYIDRNHLFANNEVYNLGVFHLQNAAIFMTMTLFKFFVEEQEKRKIKGAFQHYLNPAVINQMLDSPEGLRLGGEKKELTVFFSDVRGFTTISEILSPEALASLLNEYFTPMTDIVLDSGGLLDKYIGDALMAVWGAPVHSDDHADRALESSLKMLDALDELRKGWASRNLPIIDIGCGINTGPMVVGNMGSNQRFDYTVLGDAVNLGARLEGITKEYGVKIICSESTRKRLKNPQKFILRQLDWIKVKGKNEPVTIYEVVRFAEAERELIMKLCELFETGLDKYRRRKFAEAQLDFLGVLQRFPNDGPASVFLERCEYFLENTVGDDWDGIWVMKSK
jgi:adenylate cyclase